MPPCGRALRGGRAGEATKLFRAFPWISKFFQGKSKPFQAFSKEIPNIFLGGFQRNQGLGGDFRRFSAFSKTPRSSSPSVGAAPGERGRRGSPRRGSISSYHDFCFSGRQYRGAPTGAAIVPAESPRRTSSGGQMGKRGRGAAIRKPGNPDRHPIGALRDGKRPGRGDDPRSAPARAGGPARRRRLGDAVHSLAQHQRADDDGRAKGRRHDSRPAAAGRGEDPTRVRLRSAPIASTVRRADRRGFRGARRPAGFQWRYC